MKRYLILSILPLLLAGCCPTRIVTVTPHTSSYHPYTTTVTYPKTRTVTTTASVSAISEDISLHLDLQAIGAAFAQASTVQEFENLINSSSYMLSNLDLNGDGYVDYLRVLETVDGHNHVFIIQAVLGVDVYQDVATLVAEVSSPTSAYVQIIGDPYIYGPSYYVQPVYYATPLILAHLWAHGYRPWRSPWYWGHYPSCYRHPAPIHIGHYHAYIHTYMSGHHYCHVVHYPTSCHYPAYINICKVDIHNDYGTRYPERSFAVRNADLPQRAANSTALASQPSRTMNASIVRELNSANVRTSTSSTRSAGATSTTRSAGTTSTARSAGTTSTTRSAGTTSTARSAGTTSTTRSAGTTSTTRSAGTTTRSRVNNSGTTTTRISTVSPSGTRSTVSRNSGSTTRSSSTATRSAGSTTRSSSTATRSGSSRR